MPAFVSIGLLEMVFVTIALGMALAITLWLVSLLEQMGGVPLVGHYISSFADAIHNYVLGKLREFVNAAAGFFSGLFHGFTASLEHALDIPGVLINALEDTFTYLRHTVIPKMLDRLETRLQNAIDKVHQLVVDVNTRLDGRIHDLRHDFEQAINTLETEVVHPWKFFVGTLWPDLLARFHALRSTVVDVIQPKIGVLDRGLDHVTRDVGTYKKLAPAALLAAMLAAFPLLKTLVDTTLEESGLNKRDCRTKTKDLCSINMSLWRSLFDDALPALVLGDLLLIAREGVGIAEEVRGELGDVLH